MTSSVLEQVSPELAQFIVNVDDFEKGNVAGEGAFGKVYISIHKPTGTKCALKQLFCEKLEDRDLVEFIREIEISAKCNSMFVLPLYGWAATYPYSIVTPYIPNGSLFNALRRRPGSPRLTPTIKTKIMIGCAHGMMALHKMGVIHRDLKSMNVLLDENVCPKICDFGISRFASSERQLMTQQIGTPHWMAPELFLTSDYTNKVDVYAYAIMMWELLTESTPFKGYNGQQIAMAVCNRNERPVLPPNTPKKIKTFIVRCWDMNPDKRPSFEQICKVLDDKKVMFEGTDPDEIEMFVNEIKKDEAQRAKNKGVRQSPLNVYNSIATSMKLSNRTRTERKPSVLKLDQIPTPSYGADQSSQPQGPAPLPTGQISPLQMPPPSSFEPLNIPVITTMEEVSAVKAPEPTKVVDYNEILATLNSPVNPGYKEALISWRDHCFEINDVSQFFAAVSPCFQNSADVPPQIMSFVIKQLKVVASKSVSTLSTFIESNILYFLPYSSQDQSILNPILSLLFYLTQTMPDYFTKDFLKVCNPLVRSSPFKMLKITQELCNLFDRLENPWPGADFLLRESMPFVESEACASYLSLLVQMLLQHKPFSDARLVHSAKVFIYALEKANDEGVHAAYSCICAFFSETFIVPAQILEMHIQNPEFEKDVISYLLRDRISQRTPFLIQALVQKAETNKKAFAVLVADAARPENVSCFQMQPLTFMQSGLKIEQKLLLLMTLLLHEQLRPAIVNTNQIPSFIHNLLAENMTDYFDAASMLIIKLINQQIFIDQLRDSNIVKTYIDVAMTQKHRSAVRLSLYTIDILARSGLADLVIPTIDWILSRAVPNNYNAVFALSSLASIGASGDGALALSKSNIRNNLTMFSGNIQTQPYIDTILKEIQ